MMKNETNMTLFRQGFKAEVHFGDELTAHHMSTRSVYTFKENSNVSITHSAPYVGDVSVDKFTVSLREVKSYHESGTVAHSVTSTVETFDNFLDAYYCGVVVVNNLNYDAMVIN